LYAPAPDDISVRFEAGTSRGGGQKMNRAATMAVVKHIPTNIQVRCQDKRDRNMNVEIATLALRYKLDKEFYKEKSIAWKYEQHLKDFIAKERKKTISSSIENSIREQREIEDRRKKFSFENLNHVLVLDKSVKHVMTGDEVTIGEDTVETATEKLRQLVAEKTIQYQFIPVRRESVGGKRKNPRGTQEKATIATPAGRQGAKQEDITF
jgi:protein subunit release factor A